MKKLFEEYQANDIDINDKYNLLCAEYHRKLVIISALNIKF